MNGQQLVCLGYISGVYGVHGWVRVFSYTQPREQILNYKAWFIGSEAAADAAQSSQPEAVRLESGRVQGKGIVARLAGVDDRDRAAALIDSRIFVPRADLPEIESGQYYWADLVGLEVRTRQGDSLGVVDHLMETGAHDVMVLSGGVNHLIPFVLNEVVADVDLSARVITVDWDAAWWE
jgi:16S rRNA processing protein RimM